MAVLGTADDDGCWAGEGVKPGRMLGLVWNSRAPTTGFSALFPASYQEHQARYTGSLSPSAAPGSLIILGLGAGNGRRDKPEARRSISSGAVYI
ncbi:hypothetical protein IMZ48_09875 [Candidatus Bathyarchaeota archaeon]|nr:hypothetical protein [Candidatus Bathyarchaeota archaeon]